MRADVIYWKIFNKFIRIIGYSGFVGGLLLALFNLYSLFNPKATVEVNGVPSTDVVYKIFIVFMPVTGAFLCWLLLKVPPYYPKYLNYFSSNENSEKNNL